MHYLHALHFMTHAYAFSDNFKSIFGSSNELFYVKRLEATAQKYTSSTLNTLSSDTCVYVKRTLIYQHTVTSCLVCKITY